MHQRYLVTMAIGLCVAWQSLAGAAEVAPRITDREIIEGLTALRSGQQHLQEQMKGLETRLTDTRQELLTQIADTRKEIKDFMLWGFGVTFAGMFALIGFVIWDRRSALAPAVTRLRELEEHEARVERALKEMAQRDPNVADALRHVGLL